MASSDPCNCCGSAVDVDSVGTSDGEASDSPLDGVITTVRKKYSIRLVTLLESEGPLRYGEIKERLDAKSDATLSKRLNQLADADVVERNSYDEIPPRVEYSLTTADHELEARLEPLLD